MEKRISKSALLNCFTQLPSKPFAGHSTMKILCPFEPSSIISTSFAPVGKAPIKELTFEFNYRSDEWELVL